MAIEAAPVPRDIASKYQPHPVVRYTHNLPAGAWALLVPTVLSPCLRTRHPRLHRLAGRALLFVSALMMLGYSLILYHGLSTSHTHAADSTLLTVSKLQLDLSAAWFVLTGVMAAMAAFRRRFTTHRAWALRHLCSGMYVSLMRVFMVGMRVLPPMGLAQYDTEEQRVAGFYSAMLAAFTVAMVAAEVAVHQMKPRVSASAGLEAAQATMANRKSQ